MKNKLFKIDRSILKLSLILMAFIAPLTSCKKFLNEPIDNRSSIDQLKDLEKAIIALEPGSDHHFTDLMSDDYSYKDIAGHVVRDASEKLRPIFTFDINRQSINKNEMLASGMNPNSSFLRYYFRINNANLLIFQANKLKSEGGDLKRINNIIAHSLAIKAYCNFMLVNLFGKQYDKATAAQDLSVPYIGEYNSSAVVNRPRATVEFIYTKVEEDLLNAISLMDEKNTFFNSKFYFSKRAIYGLLSRFYLNKKDWKSSIKYADLALQIDRLPLNVKTLRTASANNSDLYSRSYFDPANTSYLMMGNNTYQLFAYFWSGFYPYPLNQFIGNSFTAGEMIQTSALFADYIPIKYIYFYSAANRNMNLPLITVDEVLFNKAEATIQDEGLFNATVKSDLTAVIDNLPFTTAAANALKTELNGITTKEAGITYILKLKRFRFFVEGIRWFDIKRHNLPVTHNYNGTDFKIDGTNPYDYVIKLPLEEIQFNGDVQ
ncbi:RagB/SusD family nutrient uptake outer membrane protein [Pedobacter sp. ASV28]|uniref:RagB/SusD family nutrient uptake outer membrane protein n=1 Tax=Pedobacter sp. ASV28 TaxID=2795123 RepID=UPI0018EB5623|nr:RagB/SusD family nutrient uptake outer membrane protein [Pedobacter sp. ASV28]